MSRRYHRSNRCAGRPVCSRPDQCGPTGSARTSPSSSAELRFLVSWCCRRFSFFSFGSVLFPCPRARMTALTELLNRLEQGDPQAADQLIPLVTTNCSSSVVQRAHHGSAHGSPLASPIGLPPKA